MTPRVAPADPLIQVRRFNFFVAFWILSSLFWISLSWYSMWDLCSLFIVSFFGISVSW